jgi:RNA polymerase sigma-70 factor, ECF subfamily
MGLFGRLIRIGNMMLAAAMSSDSIPRVDDAIARLKKGDSDALGVILSLYHHRLYRFLLRIVKDPASADDLFQETWVRIIEKIGKYDGRSNFDTWMFCVARNLAIDHLRRRQGSSLDEPDQSGDAPINRLPSTGPDALHRLLEYERADRLAIAIAELPVIHREVLSLRFEEEMKLEQIAEVTGLPLSTVKSRLCRALDGLRSLVEAGFLETRK